MNLKALLSLSRRQELVDSFFARGVNIVFLFFALLFLIQSIFHSQVYNWSSILTFKVFFLKGFAYTCLLSVLSLTVSVLLATIAALMLRSKFYLLKYVARLYVELIRGTPLLVQLLVFFYVVASALNIKNRLLVGSLTLSIFSGAYITEMIRAGIDSVHSSLLDSAKAIGMSPIQSYRYVIFPLVIRNILPPLTGQFASIIKDSSLLSILGISEMTFSAQQISSATYSTLESYLPLALGYLILTLPISLISKKLEELYKYDS